MTRWWSYTPVAFKLLVLLVAIVISSTGSMLSSIDGTSSSSASSSRSFTTTSAAAVYPVFVRSENDTACYRIPLAVRVGQYPIVTLGKTLLTL
jgi:hypothetical protein